VEADAFFNAHGSDPGEKKLALIQTGCAQKFPASVLAVLYEHSRPYVAVRVGLVPAVDVLSSHLQRCVDS
jgi:hypothetical protein